MIRVTIQKGESLFKIWKDKIKNNLNIGKKQNRI